MGETRIVRHGAMAAAVGAANAVALNQAGVAVPVTVPAGKSKITEIATAVSASIVAVASAGVTIRVVLSGNGMVSEQHFTAGILREDTTSTGGSKHGGVIARKVNFDVVPGNIIDINAFMLGVDPGTPEIDVELCFE